MKININDHDEIQSHIPTDDDTDASANHPTMPNSAAATNVDGQNKPGLGDVASEVAGHSGAHITGGDLTDAQDAGAAMHESLAQRDAEQKMWAQQQKGEVGAHTVDLKPASAHPESGLPESDTPNHETLSGDDHESQKKNDLDSAARDAINSAQNGATSDPNSGASANETTRAGVEHDEKFLRLAADFENFKRQSARRANEESERAARRVFEDLLPVLDNFERALEAARGASDVQSLRVGVEFIAQQLRDALRGHGVEAIEAKGKNFDPLLHDALEEVPNSGAPEGTILDEAQRGYRFKGQILRPSRVRVAGK